jgi:serine/threonine protein phosphatase PrpC
MFMGLYSPPKSGVEKSRTRVRYAGLSEAGRVRSVNQDSFFAGEIPGRGTLAIVADGMGGHQTGEVASQKAVSIIRQELGRSRVHPPAAIARAVQAANLEIYEFAMENPENHGMGTTLTTVLIDDQVGLVAHIGDSRAYLVRGGTIKQLTQDHSWVAERVRQGILTEDEAKRHRWRNVITNALGATPQFKLDLMHFDVKPGDRVLLCSDGISMLLDDARLMQILMNHPPEEAVQQLIQGANERGSPDNVTAVVLQVEHVEAKPKRYELPRDYQEQPATVQIGSTMSGIRKIEESYPLQDRLSKLRRKSWYPYRFWILGCLYLILLLVVFIVR